PQAGVDGFWRLFTLLDIIGEGLQVPDDFALRILDHSLVGERSDESLLGVLEVLFVGKWIGLQQGVVLCPGGFSRGAGLSGGGVLVGRGRDNFCRLLRYGRGLGRCSGWLLRRTTKQRGGSEKGEMMASDSMSWIGASHLLLSL